MDKIWKPYIDIDFGKINSLKNELGDNIVGFKKGDPFILRLDKIIEKNGRITVRFTFDKVCGCGTIHK